MAGTRDYRSKACRRFARIPDQRQVVIRGEAFVQPHLPELVADETVLGISRGIREVRSRPDVALLLFGSFGFLDTG